jgi:ABC-2 type transport system permease protein
MQLPVFLILFLAPVYVPLSLLEGWLHEVARFNPITQVLETGRDFLAGGPVNAWAAFTLAFALAAGFALWAAFGLKRAEAAGS